MSLPFWLSPQDPNITCPSCQAAWRVNVPHTLRFLCPSCETWLCWKDVELVEVKQRRAPLCPRCGAFMVERENRKNGSSFFGCEGYPSCKGTKRGGEFRVVETTVEAGGIVSLWKEFVPGEVWVEWERTQRAREKEAARLTRRRGFGKIRG